MAQTAASLMLHALQSTKSWGAGTAGKVAGQAVGAGSQMTQQAGQAASMGGQALWDIQKKAARGLVTHLPGVGKDIGKLSILSKLNNVAGLPKRLFSKGMGILGLNLSVSSLLRQSQIFTGFLGGLFQILGGFVDVLLAPFMPFFAGLMRKLAGWMPAVAEWAEDAYAFLERHVFPVIAKIGEWTWDTIVDAYNWFKEEVWPVVEEIWAWAGGFWDDTVKPGLGLFWEEVKGKWGWLQKDIFPKIGGLHNVFVKELDSLYSFTNDNWQELAKGPIKASKAATKHIATAFGDIIEWATILSPLINMVGRFLLGRVWPVFWTIFTDILDMLGDVWHFLSPVVGLLLKGFMWVMGKLIMPLLEGMVSFVEIAWTLFKKAWDWVFENVLNWELIIKYVVNPISQSIGRAIQGVMDIVWLVKNIDVIFGSLWKAFALPLIGFMRDLLPKWMGGTTGEYNRLQKEGTDAMIDLDTLWKSRDFFPTNKITYDQGTNSFDFTINNELPSGIHETEEHSVQMQARRDREGRRAAKFEFDNIMSQANTALRYNLDN